MSVESPKNPKSKPEQEVDSSYEVRRTIEIPDQSEVLDFKAFLEQPLFNRNFYRAARDPGNLFDKEVLDPSVPVVGGVGREYQETLILKRQPDEVVMVELGIEPMPLDEWRYLFSQLGEDQLAPTGRKVPGNGIDMSRNTLFFVKVTDGSVGVIRTLFSRYGGPYQYSLSLHKLVPEAHFDTKNSRVISPRG